MQFNDAVAAYIMNYQSDFLTELERRAFNHLVAQFKEVKRFELVGQEEGRLQGFILNTFPMTHPCCTSRAMDIEPFTCELRSESFGSTPTNLALTAAHDVEKLREPQLPGNVVTVFTIGITNEPEPSFLSWSMLVASVQYCQFTRCPPECKPRDPQRPTAR